MTAVNTNIIVCVASHMSKAKREAIFRHIGLRSIATQSVKPRAVFVAWSKSNTEIPEDHTIVEGRWREVLQSAGIALHALFSSDRALQWEHYGRLFGLFADGEPHLEIRDADIIQFMDDDDFLLPHAFGHIPPDWSSSSIAFSPCTAWMSDDTDDGTLALRGSAWFDDHASLTRTLRECHHGKFGKPREYFCYKITPARLRTIIRETMPVDTGYSLKSLLEQMKGVSDVLICILLGSVAEKDSSAVQTFAPAIAFVQRPYGSIFDNGARYNLPEPVSMQAHVSSMTEWAIS
jgi:hypothetical protein